MAQLTSEQRREREALKLLIFEAATREPRFLDPEVRVLLYLATFLDTARIYPAYEAIMDATGIAHDNTVRRALRGLEACGAIVVTSGRWYPIGSPLRGGPVANEYRINLPDQWKFPPDRDARVGRGEARAAVRRRASKRAYARYVMKLPESD